MTEVVTLEILLNKRKLLELQQKDLLNKTAILSLQLKDLSTEILNKCDHIWKPENAWVGPYDKPDLICDICNSVKYW